MVNLTVRLEEASFMENWIAFFAVAGEYVRLYQPVDRLVELITSTRAGLNVVDSRSKAKLYALLAVFEGAALRNAEREISELNCDALACDENMLDLVNRRRSLISSIFLTNSSIGLIACASGCQADTLQLQESAGPILMQPGLNVDLLESLVSDGPLTDSINITEELAKIDVSKYCGFNLQCLKRRQAARFWAVSSRKATMQQVISVGEEFRKRLAQCWTDCSPTVEVFAATGKRLKAARTLQMRRLQQLRLWYCRSTECFQVLNETVLSVRAKFFDAWDAAIVQYNYPVVDRLISLLGVIGNSLIVVCFFALLALGMKWGTWKSFFWLVMLGCVLAVSCIRLAIWSILLGERPVGIFEPDNKLASVSVKISW